MLVVGAMIDFAFGVKRPDKWVQMMGFHTYTFLVKSQENAE